MGAPGHRFIAHTKALSPRAQAKDGGYGPPAHPLVVRPGQRYWPRTARRRVVLTVKRVDREHALMEHPSRGQAPVRVRLARLLATGADGQGQYYRFQGFVQRRYASYAYVWSLDGGQAILSIPEWHPGRAIRLPARLVPEDGRREGMWLRLRCDLSASSAGRLQVADLVTCATPDLEIVASPALDAALDRS